MASLILNRHFPDKLRNNPILVIWPYSEAHLVQFFIIQTTSLSSNHLGLPTEELRLISVEVCLPVTRLAAHRPFHREIGQQTEEIAAHNVNQDLNRLRQLNVLPFSASWRCYLGNLR